MAGRKRKKQTYAAVIGLVGSGTVSIKSAKSNLSDFIEAQDGEILWVLPHTADVTKSVAKVKDFLWDENANYALVSDATDDDEEWEENAQSTVDVEDDVFATLVTEVTGYEAETLAIMFILDEESDDDLELLDAAQAQGLKCFDLASGITELELAEIDEEEAAEEDDESEDADEDDESDAPEVRDEPPFSAKVQKFIDKGNFARAGEEMAEELGPDGVKELADEFGLEFKKGTWAKNIGKGIAEYLGGAAGDGGDPVEEDEEVEEAPAPKAKKKSKKAAEPAPEVDEEPEPVTEEQLEKAADTLRPNAEAPARALHDADLIYFLAQIAASQGTAEAKAFYTFINDKFPR